MRKTLPTVSFALAFMAAALSGCNGSGEGSNTQEPPLIRAFVVTSSSGTDAVYTGTVRARVESELSFRVTGQIISRSVDEGETVRQGQVLMRIDPADYALAVSATSEQLRAAEAEAARAAADANRLQGLVSAGAISASNYDAAVAAKNASAARVRSLKAQLGEVRNQSGYTTLRADAAGIVTRISAESGQVVSPGVAVMTLARAGAREAVVSVPEDRVAALPKTATASPYGTDTVSTAVLREISGAADPLTRTFTARYTLRGEAANAPIGSTVSVRLDLPDVPAQLSVPLGALHEIDGKAGVWAIGNDQKLDFIEVEIDHIGEELARVRAQSLKPGMQIVALGANRLRADQAVRVLKRGGQ